VIVGGRGGQHTFLARILSSSPSSPVSTRKDNMRVTKQQKELHLNAIARWFANRRKTTVQKVLLDLRILPPSKHPEDVFYSVTGRRTNAVVVAGKGEVWRWIPGVSETNSLGTLIGNVFEGFDS
jgi:hypothetical protein